MLDRLVAEGVRYGRDFALVRISVPLGSAEEVAPLLAASLRDADVVVRWEADELLALLPATERAGAEPAAGAVRARPRGVRRLGGGEPARSVAGAGRGGGGAGPERLLLAVDVGLAV